MVEPVTDKELLRELTKEALLDKTDARRRVVTPRDWHLWDSLYPVIELRSLREAKESLGRAMPPEFTTTAIVSVNATVQKKTPESALLALDLIERQIKQAVLASQPILARIQQFSRVTSEQDVNADGEQHLGTVQVDFYMEFYEEFDPMLDVILSDLETVNIHVDSTNIIDTTGTYDNPPFPAAVTPAPRTIGPDGRDEGTLNLNLTEQ